MRARGVPLLSPPKTHWECPSCDETAVTSEHRVHTQLHACKGMNGLMVPFVQEGINAHHVPLEREDYVGKEEVQTDGEGNVIMSVQTIRDDGEDVTIYAPTALGTFDE